VWALPGYLGGIWQLGHGGARWRGLELSPVGPPATRRRSTIPHLSPGAWAFGCCPTWQRHGWVSAGVASGSALPLLHPVLFWAPTTSIAAMGRGSAGTWPCVLCPGGPHVERQSSMAHATMPHQVALVRGTSNDTGRLWVKSGLL